MYEVLGVLGTCRGLKVYVGVFRACRSLLPNIDQEINWNRYSSYVSTGAMDTTVEANDGESPRADHGRPV